MSQNGADRAVGLRSNRVGASRGLRAGMTVFASLSWRASAGLRTDLGTADEPAPRPLCWRGNRGRDPASTLSREAHRPPSLNPGYLAAPLSGYRHYHQTLGRPSSMIPMAVSIWLRRPGEAGGGNRIAGVDPTPVPAPKLVAAGARDADGGGVTC